MKLESFGLTDTGCKRTNNEDCFLIAEDAKLYLVADGMGGAQAGEHASQLAAVTVGNVISSIKEPSDAVLAQAFEQANLEVLLASRRDFRLEGMGTTLVAILGNGQKAYVANVGDSRAYLYHKGQLRILSEDQTWVNEIGRKLGLPEEQLKKHPLRNVLTMAIGVADQVRIHSSSVELEAGMVFLLCSDGLHGVIPDSEIGNILQSGGELEHQAATLIEKAKQAGGPDNITTVLLRVA